jgi:hypothetical protein
LATTPPPIAGRNGQKDHILAFARAMGEFAPSRGLRVIGQRHRHAQRFAAALCNGKRPSNAKVPGFSARQWLSLISPVTVTPALSN